MNSTTSSDSTQVSIYYDSECRFCQRSVELIVKLFLVRVKEVAPAQSQLDILTAMRQHNSWVVINPKGEKFFTFMAGVEIAKYSPVLKLLVPLTKIKFVRQFGEWTYRKIAYNRKKIWLP